MRRRILRVMLILLLLPPVLAAVAGWLVAPAYLHPIRRELTPDLIRGADASFALTHADREPFEVRRSEEHTSELQSRLHLVCRLLLEKKKTASHDTRTH